MQPLFLGSHPLIDFLNTSLSPNGVAVETIDSGKAYLDWLVAAGLLDKSRADELAERIGSKALDAAAAEARKVREWMRAWLSRWRAHPRADYRKETAVLNELLSRAQLDREVVRTKGEFRIVERSKADSAAALLGLIAKECAALLTEEQPKLIKSCAGATCTLWFLDRTKSHRRAFCSAAVCGNRARVAAFRERQRG